MLMLLEHYHAGRFSLELIARKTAHTVAEMFGVAERGYIREGYYADLVVVELDAATTVTADNVLYKCGWSPLEGFRFNSAINMTVVNGHIAFHDGRVSAQPNGQRLTVAR
jgi:dihydroorotase